MSPSMCVQCKGNKMLCGKPKCERLEKAKALGKLKPKVSKDMSGNSPGVFVGSVGYPKLLTGPMISPFERNNMDTPEAWYGTPLEEIVQMRYLLVRSKEPMRVQSAKKPNRHLQEIQDIALSKKAVDTEASFYREPRVDNAFSSVSAPWGTSGYLKDFKVTENAPVARKVDSIVSDELKAAEQVKALYNEAPVSQISKILSVGLLGIDKKLVPTRWSITAADDMVGKQLIEEVKEFEELNYYQIFTSTYLGNHFEILLAPGKWAFENQECWMPGNIWLDKGKEAEFVIDREPYEGRKKYADNITGAYYAARLAVLEYLKRRKRQATAFVLREITPDYWCPVGVWQIRENVRAAMKEMPTKLQTLEESLEELEKRMLTKRTWEKKSELLARLKSREVMRKYFM